MHSAQYRRKPRGRPAGLGDEHDWRFSLCCARDGCRTRKTPPSLRFLGRKVYLAAMVVLIAIMREGATAARMRQLSGLVGVDRRTVERWREWWRDTFTASPFWQIGRAAFMPPVDQDRLPASLIERFTGRGGERLIALLRFIAPITGGGDVAERHAVVSRPLKLAARKHPGGVAVNQNPQQHPGMVRRRAGAAIGADHAAKIEPVDHLDDKTGQMPLRQPLVDRRRQKKRRPAINVPEIAHRQQATLRRESMAGF